MRFASVIGSMLLLVSDVRADEWTSVDTALEASLFVLAAADYGQTRHFLDHGTAYETNPLLGTHPSRGKLLAFGATGLVLHAAIARVLPTRFRRPWQYLALGVETYCVVGNAYDVGVHWKF